MMVLWTTAQQPTQIQTKLQPTPLLQAGEQALSGELSAGLFMDAMLQTVHSHNSNFQKTPLLSSKGVFFYDTILVL